MSERLHGKVKFVGVSPDWAHYGYIAGSNNRDYYWVQKDVTPDNRGLQTLEIGEAVEFTPFISARGLQAVQIVSARPDEPEDPTYRDDAVVIYLFEGRGKHRGESAQNGFARRPTGEKIHVAQSNIITEGSLEVGTWIRFRPERSSPHFTARDVEIYMDS